MKRLCLILITCLSLIGRTSHAQMLMWLDFITHSGTSNALTKDIAGNQSGTTFYLIQFVGTVSIDSLIFSSPSHNDFVIVKRDVNENLIWARRISCNDAFNCRSIAADALGNVYLVGSYDGTDTVRFDSTVAVQHTLPVYLNLPTGYIAKYDPAGTLQWVKTIEGQPNPNGQEIIDLSTIRVNGNSLFVTGLIYGVFDFDPSASSTLLGSVGNSARTPIVSFDMDGNINWGKVFGSYNIYINYLCFTSDKGVLIGGNLNGSSVDLDPGPLNTSFNALGASDIFVTRLDSMGNYQWTRIIIGSGTQIFSGITLLNDTNFIICGITDATVDLDPGPGVCSINCTSGEKDFLVIYNMSSDFIAGGDVSTSLTPEHVFLTGFNEVLLMGGVNPGHYAFVFTDTSFATGAVNQFGGPPPGCVASSHYFRAPFTFYVGGNSTGNNFYGNNGSGNVNATTLPFTGFVAKYSLGWGPKGIESDVVQDSSVLLYPNPANDVLMLKLTAVSEQLNFIHIYDIAGNLVLCNQHPVSDSGCIITNVSGLTAGSYICVCLTDKGEIRKRFVITR